MHIMLDFLYPRKCILCQRVLRRHEYYMCDLCTRENQPRKSSRGKLKFLKDWYALWPYELNVRDSIRRFKFGDRQSYAAGYAYFLKEELEAAWEIDLITWVPLSKRRKRIRGYDQGEELAKNLALELSVPLESTLLKCVDNPAQSGISGAAQRRANVLGVYRVKDASVIKGKRILLVDDVVTTGATASECARMLLTAGAKEVYLVTVAAVPRLK